MPSRSAEAEAGNSCRFRTVAEPCALLEQLRMQNHHQRRECLPDEEAHWGIGVLEESGDLLLLLRLSVIDYLHLAISYLMISIDAADFDL